MAGVVVHCKVMIESILIIVKPLAELAQLVTFHVRLTCSFLVFVEVGRGIQNLLPQEHLLVFQAQITAEGR